MFHFKAGPKPCPTPSTAVISTTPPQLALERTEEERKKKKPTSFLDLPAELRNHIYDLATVRKTFHLKNFRLPAYIQSSRLARHEALQLVCARITLEIRVYRPFKIHGEPSSRITFPACTRRGPPAPPSLSERLIANFIETFGNKGLFSKVRVHVHQAGGLAPSRNCQLPATRRFPSSFEVFSMDIIVNQQNVVEFSEGRKLSIPGYQDDPSVGIDEREISREISQIKAKAARVAGKAGFEGFSVKDLEVFV